MSNESRSDGRKKQLKSFLNRISGTSNSLRSRGSSMFLKLQKEMMGYQEKEGMKIREWLLAGIEFLLAFSWDFFVSREKSQKVMELRDVTPRQDTMETLFWLGCASILNLIVGQLMDSVTGNYFMALLNVAVHFSLAALSFIGEIVNEISSEDLYAHLLSHVRVLKVIYEFERTFYGVGRFATALNSHCIFSVDQEGYVYAMDQVAGKGAEFMYFFTFIIAIFKFAGIFLFTVLKDTTSSDGLMAAIALTFNGTAMFLFAYILRPKPRLQLTPPPGSAIKVWGVVFTALRNKRKFGKTIKRSDWLDYAENKYDKAQIMRTRRILGVIVMATPTAGFLLFTRNKTELFSTFFDSLKLSGPGVPTYFKWIIQCSAIAATLVVELFVFPVMRAMKIKVNFMKRFLFGYMSLLLGVLMASVISSTSEKLLIRPTSGILRFYNTIEKSLVTLKSQEADFTRLRFTVGQFGAVFADFETRETVLFKMAASFVNQFPSSNATSNETHYTLLFSVSPEEVTAYVSVAPARIFRVPGFLPAREAPPGKNDRWMPRCFLVNLIEDRSHGIYATDPNTDERIEKNAQPGQVNIFQVPEGNYTLQLMYSHVKTEVTFVTGGVYGIYLYVGLQDYAISVDTIIPGNTNPAMLGLAVNMPLGIAQGIGQVALDVFVYATAPEGLKGMAFGFYTCLANLSSWFLLFGFYTWHHYITPPIMVIYTILGFVSFFLCLVLLIKYKNYYKM